MADRPRKPLAPMETVTLDMANADRHFQETASATAQDGRERFLMLRFKGDGRIFSTRLLNEMMVG